MKPINKLTTTVLAALGLAGVFLVSPASAAIEFEATEVTIKPVAGGPRTLTAEFKFKNTGAQPVSIVEVAASCGCTAPEAPKEPVAAGASGVIPVNYAAGERQGRQTQSIRVRTSEGENLELRLVVDLPVRVSFAPRLLLLGPGEASTKTATVTFGDDLPMTLLEAVSDRPGFEMAEPPKLEDNVLKLVVRVVGESPGDGRGVIRIRTKGASGTEYTDLLYTRYRP
jgi:hypothetical protein